MSKQKRIKKIVKSRLHRIKPDGDPEFATTQNKIDALASLNALADGGGVTANDDLLLDVLGISNPGAINEKLDVDLDTVADNLDAFPRNAVEQKDTDGDGIGDNRDILETKLRLDAIFQDLASKDATTALARATGTLQRLMDEAEAVQLLIKTQFETLDSGHDNAGAAVDAGKDIDDINAARTAIGNLVAVDTTDQQITGAFNVQNIAGVKFTSAGLDQIVADIDTQVAQVTSLKAEIDAMTATAGVKVKSPAVTGYANAGDSVLAKAAAAVTATGNGASPAAIATLANAAKEKITKAIAADSTSGAKAMLVFINTITIPE